ncbi:hypothetical protein [Halobaculum rubrum]|uniref:hypothetical protein n=1 Tax=Halobaculum rubrum TaxID=2872158 RepID=UPI001CA42015|nr:hypothetical protein [Halobaculum rubrum]QZX99139.1 hypothetical protein K6T25_12875 [Halobaculum rubrum]
MTTRHGNTDDWKRLVTTTGLPVGWARRGSNDKWHVRPKPGLLRGCDSWIAPSWHERGQLTLDATAVVGEGDATVVLATEAVPEALRDGTTDDDTPDDTPRSADTRP